MTRKHHLENTSGGGPVCQRGRIGAALRGEHITLSFEDFIGERSDLRCTRCEKSTLFAYLQRQHQKKLDAWEPVDDPDAWKVADDALISARRSV